MNYKKKYYYIKLTIHSNSIFKINKQNFMKIKYKKFI